MYDLVGHAYWTDKADCMLELDLRTLSYIDGVSNLDADVVPSKMAHAVGSNVGIRFFGVETSVVFYVFEGLGRQASTAAEIVEPTGAVHQLLFR